MRHFANKRNRRRGVVDAAVGEVRWCTNLIGSSHRLGDHWGTIPSSSQRLPSSHPLADLASPSLASSVVVVTVVPSIALSLQSHTAFYIKERANGANTHRDEREAPPLLRQVWDYPVPILRVWLPRPSLFSNGHSLPASLPLSLLPSLPNLQQSLAAAALVSPHPRGERTTCEGGVYDILGTRRREKPHHTLTTTPSRHRFFSVPSLKLLSPSKLASRCYQSTPRHITLFVPLFPIPFQTNRTSSTPSLTSPAFPLTSRLIPNVRRGFGLVPSS